jgi:hypothetical protein
MLTQRARVRKRFPTAVAFNYVHAPVMLLSGTLIEKHTLANPTRARFQPSLQFQEPALLLAPFLFFFFSDLVLLSTSRFDLVMLFGSVGGSFHIDVTDSNQRVPLLFEKFRQFLTVASKTGTKEKGTAQSMTHSPLMKD